MNNQDTARVNIKYHHPYPNGGRFDVLVDVVGEDIHVFCCGVSINSVVTSHMLGSTTIYLTTKPTRIDRQGEDIFMLDEKTAKRNKEPYRLSSHKPSATIWESGES